VATRRIAAVYHGGMRAALFALLTLLMLGCTPSPEGLCEHMTKVVEKQYGPDDPKDPKGAHDRGVKRCTEIWSAKKKENAKAYECYAKCADDVKNIVDLASCKPKCYPNEPKPPDETDKLEGIIEFNDAGAPAPSASKP
jgi:hypothetical protein